MAQTTSIDTATTPPVAMTTQQSQTERAAEIARLRALEESPDGPFATVIANALALGFYDEVKVIRSTPVFKSWHFPYAIAMIREDQSRLLLLSLPLPEQTPEDAAALIEEIRNNGGEPIEIEVSTTPDRSDRRKAKYLVLPHPEADAKNMPCFYFVAGLSKWIKGAKKA